MAAMYPDITDRVRRFIEAQHMFFVGTAARDGRVNVSPKGLDSLRVLASDRVVWLNGTGSGNESAAHVRETGRMTLMFCAFEGNPWIVRVYGAARVVHETDADWAELTGMFPPMLGARNVFDLAVESVQTSCGFGVPLFEYQGQRDMMDRWAQNKGPGGLVDYQREFNVRSIDGYPTGLPVDA